MSLLPGRQHYIIAVLLRQSYTNTSTKHKHKPKGTVGLVPASLSLVLKCRAAGSTVSKTYNSGLSPQGRPENVGQLRMMDSPRTPSNTADVQAVASLQQQQQGQAPTQEQQPQLPPCGQQVALCAVRDWRFSKAAEDVEWLLTWSSGDGALVTSSWQVLYSISHAATWAQLQRFLLPRLTRLRGWCQGGAAPGSGSLAEGLYRPTPHAFQPWSRDVVLDWRFSRTRGQLLFLVRRFSPATNAQTCDEWCEMCVGNLSMWLLVKNYLLQALLLEEAYLAPPEQLSPPTPDAFAAVDAASPVEGSNSPTVPAAAAAGEAILPSGVAAAGSLSSGAGPWQPPISRHGACSGASQQQQQEDQQSRQWQLAEEQQQQELSPHTQAVLSPAHLPPPEAMVVEPQPEAAAAQPSAWNCPPLWGWLPPGALPPPGWLPLSCPMPVYQPYPPQQQLPVGSSPQVLPWSYNPTAVGMAVGGNPPMQLTAPALACPGDPMAAFLGSPFASNTALVAAAAAAAAAVLARYGGLGLGRPGVGPDASSSRAATATQVVLGGPPTSMAADTGLAPSAATAAWRFSVDGCVAPSASAGMGGGEGWMGWDATGPQSGALPCLGPSFSPGGPWPSSSAGAGGPNEALAPPCTTASH